MQPCFSLKWQAGEPSRPSETTPPSRSALHANVYTAGVRISRSSRGHVLTSADMPLTWRSQRSSPLPNQRPSWLMAGDRRERLAGMAAGLGKVDPRGSPSLGPWWWPWRRSWRRNGRSPRLRRLWQECVTTWHLPNWLVLTGCRGSSPAIAGQYVICQRLTGLFRRVVARFGTRPCEAFGVDEIRWQLDPAVVPAASA
jgi:hypothetical protein